ncbi:LOB domain-containing protein 33-like [Corylus avellana]|uniref:LOB domain-containing protein 33-like n=1 Tax=Corylus avellana TaxID=13451 RepID=UPI00286A2619|nr:LOB domain-containing protein 33-like [Corylus avellana]
MTGIGSSCGACKFLRRKCTSECVFAPYFCYEQAATHFAAVHKVFGASNVSKLLFHLPVHNRSDAAATISYEALARVRDPVYGCFADIFALQQQVAHLQEEIEILGSQMANFAVGVASCGSSQATTNPSNGLQFSSQHDVIHTQYYQNQQAALLSHTESATPNQAFDTQMDIPLHPLYGWENQNLFDDSGQNLLESILEGIEEENFTRYPWLYNSTDAKT